MGAAAAAAGPTIGALLTEYASWRWIFLVNVPICAVVVFLGVRLLRESRDPHAEGLPDPLGVVLVAGDPGRCSASPSSRARLGLVRPAGCIVGLRAGRGRSAAGVPVALAGPPRAR